MTKHILIVEDQPDIRKLVRMALAHAPYEIHEATDGASGLQMAEMLRPDLVLLDVMMPGELNGLKVCQRIKQSARLRSMAIVLLTARGQHEDIAEGMRAGCDAYIVKPFSPLALSEMVEKLLNNRPGPAN